MSDDREFWTDDQHDPVGGDHDADDAAFNDGDAARYHDDLPPDVPAQFDSDDDAADSDDYPLLSTDVFESELEALAAYDDDDDGAAEQGDLDRDETAGDADRVSAEPDESESADMASQDPTEAFQSAPIAAAVGGGIAAADSDVILGGDEDTRAVDDEDDRLRGPRAGRFRRMVQHQLAMLPLALLLLALGGYLLARGQDVSGLPDLTDGALVVISVLTVGFAAVFHALLSGRRERGLLFVGLWVLGTAGLIAALVSIVDANPDMREWWPVGLWSAGIAFVFNYLIERAHDARLVLLAIIALVAGTAAYLVTSNRLDRDALNDVAEYWPLLLSVVGVSLLPLVFRRRTE